MSRFESNRARLAVLTLVHFSVDFCGGLTIPLPEPTLIRHLQMGLPQVALLVGGFAIVVNVIQPVSGAFMPKRGAPILLLLGPLLAAFTAGVGLSSSYLGVAAMLVVGGVGIGIVHPEGALAAHSVSGRHKGLGVSIFMSGGYFGFATGSLVSGTWLAAHGQGLSGFWMLGAPAIVVAVLVLFSGLHRLHDEGGATNGPEDGPLPFAPVLLLAICIAINVCLLVRFMPILLVRRFPGPEAQAWGGATVFATGITGALGSFLWGHLSERYGRGRMIALAQLLCIPFLYQLTRVSSASAAPYWALGVGFSFGGVFPLSVVLARESHGVPQRLRMGLAIGGAWAVGEVAFILGSKYVGRFPEGSVPPVVTVLGACWVMLGATTLVALAASVLEQRAKKAAA